MKKFILFTVLSIIIFLKQNISGQELEEFLNSKIINVRTGHSAIYYPTNKQMIIFGGWAWGKLLSDIWVYNIEEKKWEKVEIGEEKPAARHWHRTVYNSELKQMIIFGGMAFENNFFSDMWVLDIKNYIWKEIKTTAGEKVPPKRVFCSTIYDPTNKQIIIFGGQYQERRFSDLWVFDIEKKGWKEIETEGCPSARSFHSAIYDTVNKRMIIFGGEDQRGKLSDTWIYDIEKKEWKEIKTEGSPSVRSFHSAIYDTINKQMIIFGGSSAGEPLSDIWIYNIEKQTWEEIKTAISPPSRYDHSAIYDPVNEQMVIFGGSGKTNALSDIWKFNIKKKRWEEKGKFLISVRDEEENPIQHVFIEVQKADKIISVGATGENGENELAIDEGKYMIIVKKDGYEDKAIKIDISNKDIKNINLKIKKK